MSFTDSLDELDDFVFFDNDSLDRESEDSLELRAFTLTLMSIPKSSLPDVDLEWLEELDLVNCLLSDELGTEIDFLLFELLDELELELDDSGFLTTGFVFLPSFRNALKSNLLFFLFFTEDTFDVKEEEDIEDDVTEDVLLKS